MLVVAEQGACAFVCHLMFKKFTYYSKLGKVYFFIIGKRTAFQMIGSDSYGEIIIY
jgi:hypothetical protein